MVKIIRHTGLPMNQLRAEMDRMLGGFFPVLEPTVPAGSLPVPVDVQETDEEVTVRAELPGMDPESIEVNFEGDVLTIAGEKRDEREEDSQGWHLSERRFGSIQRAVALPKGIDAAAVKAEHKHGVLTVHLPKSPELKARRIPVRAEGSE
jgi:HSP20 family protein